MFFTGWFFKVINFLLNHRVFSTFIFEIIECDKVISSSYNMLALQYCFNSNKIPARHFSFNEDQGYFFVTSPITSECFMKIIPECLLGN